MTAVNPNTTPRRGLKATTPEENRQYELEALESLLRSAEAEQERRARLRHNPLWRFGRALGYNI